MAAESVEEMERLGCGARRVQGLFRATVLASYDLACAISVIDVPEFLVASHILPWARDEGRRLDPRNGIAHSALHDRAIDRGLITLDESLRVVVSGRLRAVAWHRERVLLGGGGEIGNRKWES